MSPELNFPDPTSTSRTVLHGDKLGRDVGGKTILSEITFSVAAGELLGIVGASGSGKSSLLRLLNRLDEPTRGSVCLDGKDYRQLAPRELRRRVGMVTQRAFLFPGDVAGNLRFGPKQRSELLSDAEVERLLDQVGLPGFAGREVSNLSGGEQQRVSLARALANHPEVLLLDEPTSALDEESKMGVEELVLGLVSGHTLTAVMVTHDREQARRMCHRILLLEAGNLIATGTAAEVFRA